jgi:hypothetical protein
MVNAPADIPEPQVGKKPTTLSSGVFAQEAQNVIRKAFPYEGDLRVRHLWTTDGFSRFRANWFREVDGKTMIVKSLFLSVARIADDLAVQDETAMR